jgi:DNA-directed RNA polymerase beta subunit
LKHLVADKLSTTSLGNLSDIREKAQKVGEMEILSLEAHNCKYMINEIALIKSNVTQKPRVLREILSSKNDRSLLSISSYNKLSPAFSEFMNVFRCYGIKLDSKSKKQI